MANANAITTATAPADDSVIRNHERLIRHLASRFTSGGALVDDLVQEGRIALWRASTMWRGDNGASLWTYARRFVLAAMIECATTHVQNAHDELNDELVAEGLDIEVGMLVRECLELLDADEREVVRLFMEGESIRGIAAALGRSKSDIDRIFRSAVATIRERAGVTS